MEIEVSVILPAKDAAATLGEALDSLQAQTMPRWEAIVVDDSSSDGTVEVVQAHAARDPRIRAVTVRAGSAAAARNTGIAMARGRRLLFLDADDWIAPQHLERLIGVLAANPGATAAYCGFHRVGPDGASWPAIWRADIAEAPREAFAQRPGTAIHAVLVDRAAVTAAGGFDPTLRTCEDWDLWQRLAMRGARFAGTPDALCFYRTRPGSLSHAHRQLLTDGMQVLQRGGAAIGAPEDAWLLPATYLAAWCAAAEIGAGREGLPLLEAAAPRAAWNEDVDSLRNTVIEGLEVGGALARSQIVAAWPEMAGRVDAVLRWLEESLAQPGLARRLTYAIEGALLDAPDLAVPCALGVTMGVRMELRHLQAIRPPPGVDLAVVHICQGGRRLRRLELPLLGPLGARQIAAACLDEFGHLGTLQRTGVIRRPAFWIKVLRSAPSLAWDAAARMAGRRRHAPSLRAVSLAALGRAILAGVGPPPRPDESGALLDAIRVRAAEEAARLPKPPPAPPPPMAAGGTVGTEPLQSDWDAVFAQPDPWNYGSDYETVKYRRTLSILPEGPIGQALELACAEGHFTEMLAPRVGRLISTDISPRALERAAARCAAHPNLSFRKLDLAKDPLPPGCDLVVCTEVLYYLPGVDELRAVAGKIRDALSMGGHVVTAHAFVLDDGDTRTGFDWHHAFGGETIARVFSETTGLVRERSIVTDLYRIDRFRRDDGPPPLPMTEHAPIGCTLPPAVARQIVWGGAEARRRDLRTRVAADRVPVLMYHRIAEDGPPSLARYRVAPAMFEAQLRHLRRRGFHAIDAAELHWSLATRRPLPGRPVLITFDDGYRDFRETAWPMLQANDFTAEVFVATDTVGGTAAWDSGHGPPAPLLDWDDIVALSREGVGFGSHLAHHVHGDSLSTAELAEELARSRATLEARLGRRATALAAPYGTLDARFLHLTAACGYEIGFSVRPAWARIGDPLLALPRLEVFGAWDLDDFAAAVERPQ
ncbi:trifunctional glycosyltransferase/class I SAM-dependent methyltransferase/polysaccharide deacetylase [Neoroseomonas soli]|uniref:Chitooligosaccharide deacetylase n=1 Tax=Neoroseomonas soli TaxID=1081025 RepID=A0A9X9WSP9_9PROT|nr:trifunctional glycosyltransferase/class I SAM-dependent methyltransferase/polysaccharide deacetylase [Neoroseomonas soli]MBR0670178.1 glycosyltransferase [Neoroseomonas soli]